MIRNAQDDDSYANVAETIFQGPPARAKSSDSAQTTHMRQVPSVLKSIAILIAPRPSLAERPIIITTASEA